MTLIVADGKGLTTVKATYQEEKHTRKSHFPSFGEFCAKDLKSTTIPWVDSKDSAMLVHCVTSTTPSRGSADSETGHRHVFTSVSSDSCLHIRAFTSVPSHPCLHIRTFTSVSSLPCLHIRAFTFVSSHLCLHIRVSTSVFSLASLPISLCDHHQSTLECTLN